MVLKSKDRLSMLSQSAFPRRLSRLLLALPLLAASPAAPESPVALLPLECESDLALSAAPEHLRAEAAVYVLEKTGYRQTRESKNGFTCIVNRDHPRVLKPTCFDQEGAETIVPKILFVGKEMMAGTSLAIIKKQVEEGFASGAFISPRKPGIAYMLSRYNRPYNPSTDKLGWFSPHVMFYAPNMTPDDIGFSMEAWHADPRLPFIGYQGPHGYMIVISDDGQKRSRTDLRSCPDWVHSNGRQAAAGSAQ